MSHFYNILSLKTSLTDQDGDDDTGNVLLRTIRDNPGRRFEIYVNEQDSAVTAELSFAVPKRRTDESSAGITDDSISEELSHVLAEIMVGQQFSADVLLFVAYYLSITVLKTCPKRDVAVFADLLGRPAANTAATRVLVREYEHNRIILDEASAQVSIVIESSGDRTVGDLWLHRWVAFCMSTFNRSTTPQETGRRLMSAIRRHLSFSTYRDELLRFFISRYGTLRDVTLTERSCTQGIDARKRWLQAMDRVARPVLSNLAEGTLKKNMRVALSPSIDNEWRKDVVYLEAFARTLSGLSPWLNSDSGGDDEQAVRKQYRHWAVQALHQCIDPASADYFLWHGPQPLVDASYLALALIRCPWLWGQLDTPARLKLIDALKLTRNTVPVYSNWVLFPAMIETFFAVCGLAYDPIRIEFAVRSFLSEWYCGDGLFSDGPDFNADFYNSIVIHPFLANILTHLPAGRYTTLIPVLNRVNDRYAELLERMINTDGTFPVIGRSITYRAGLFHHLADIALRERLPASLSAGQVRAAMTAVIQKTFEAPSTFDEHGWLTIGLYGHQPDLADPYITTGSVYMCANAFLPLGLPENHEFWTSREDPWTSVKLWRGENGVADRALKTGRALF